MKIKQIKRLKSSKLGNPNYSITFDDYTTLKTTQNAGFAYAISNSWIDREVKIELNKRGFIINMELIN